MTQVDQIHCAPQRVFEPMLQADQLLDSGLAPVLEQGPQVHVGAGVLFIRQIGAEQIEPLEAILGFGNRSHGLAQRVESIRVHGGIVALRAVERVPGN